MSTNRQFFLPQTVNRNFLRRTKATAPPDTTETATPTDNTETTTNKFTRRGNSKFKPRKEVGEKKVVGEKNENRTQQSSLNSGARRSERPTATRKFVRRRPGGANPNPASSTTASSPTSSTVGITRRPFRIASRRRPPFSTIVTTTTTTTTPAPTTTYVTTAAYEDEESLQDIGDIDAIEDPSLEPRTPKTNTKTQRRPLVSLKEDDQNPSATNEEEKKRQSKKFSASIKQNQLDDLLRTKSSSQEEDTTEKKTTDDYTAETALAIAAHQLITAPVPSVSDIEENNTPTKKTQTTVEYKYTSREYNQYLDRTPRYEEQQTTPIYRSTIGQNYDQTTAFRIPTDFDSPKITTIDFEIPRSTPSKFATNPTLDEYLTTARDPYTSAFEAPKISTTTYNVPKSYLTNYPTTDQEYYRTTAGNDYSIATDYDAAKGPPTYTAKAPTTYPKTISQEYIRTTEGAYSETPEYNSRIPTSFKTRAPSTGYPTNTDSFIRTTGSPFTETVTEFPSRLSSYDSKFPSTNQYIRTTQESYESTESNTGRISTTYAPTRSSLKYFETTLDTETPTEINTPRVATTNFAPRSTVATRSRSRYEGRDRSSTANVIPVGFSGVEQRSESSTPRSRSRGEKLIPIPVDDTGYSTAGYSSGSREPSYFTREYLLESPVTKTYDEEYQYLSPITSPQTPQTTTTTTTTTTLTPRRVFRKKIQRKISTTQRPTTRPPLTTPSPITTQSPITTPLTTTVKPRRVPSKKPFDKISKPESKKIYTPIENYDYYDDGQEKLAGKYAQGTKVVLHNKGNIECLDIGNFPHPTSCKKFISCAKMENGGFLGWEYVCPQGLSFDPVGGICNWSAGLGCDEKDA